MAKNENSEQLQEEKPLEEMFTELDLLLFCVINPDCIIIGPDYPDTEDFINKIRSAVRNFVPEFVERNAIIRYSKINEDSFMLGGYYYTLETLCKRGNIFELIRTAKALP